MEKHGKRMRKQEKINIVPIFQETFFTSELSKVIQDAISLILHYRTMSQFRTISSEYIYHIGCAINLHSIFDSDLIPGRENLSKKQTVFFLTVNPTNKEHKDPETIDLNAPCLAQNMQTAWKKDQNTVY